jgi:hypothetical protein
LWLYENNNTSETGEYPFYDTSFYFDNVSPAPFSGSYSGNVNSENRNHGVPATWTPGDTMFFSFDGRFSDFSLNNRSAIRSADGSWEWEFDITSREMTVRVNGTEAGTGSTDPYDFDTWHNFACLYLPNGTTTLYVDGVDVTVDNSAGTGADLTGPWIIFDDLRGYIDNARGISDYIPTATQLARLQTAPQELMYKSGGGNNDTIVTDSFELHATTLLEYEIDAGDVGPTSEAVYPTHWTGVRSYRRASNSWTTSVSSSLHPHVESTTWDSSGTPITTYASVWTMCQDCGTYKPLEYDPSFPISEEDYNNLTVYNPQNFYIGFAPQSGPLNIAFSYAVQYDNTAGWADAIDDREWKLPALWAGQGDEYKEIWPTNDYLWLRYKAMQMGKGQDASASMQKHVTYDQGGDYDPGIEEMIPYLDPTTGDIYDIDISDEKVIVITVFIYVDREGYGFREVFIDGKYSTGLYQDRSDPPQTPVRLTNGNIDWDAIQLGYWWGGKWYEGPTSGDAAIRFLDGAQVYTINPSSKYYTTTRHYRGDRMILPAKLQRIANYQD